MLYKSNLLRLKLHKHVFKRLFSTNSLPTQVPTYLILSPQFDEHTEIKRNLKNDMLLYENFITPVEEQSLVNEVDPYLKRMRYEFDHWDDAIHGYKETERLKWNDQNTLILNKVRQIAFQSELDLLQHVHVLDLVEEGYIKPHIDATRFCGDTIAGLSLLTDSVMRLVHSQDKTLVVDIFLKQYSLYIMKYSARFDFTHEILSNEQSLFKDVKVHKKRRISIICRNQPKDVT